jgi:hypothetical protein
MMCFIVLLRIDPTFMLFITGLILAGSAVVFYFSRKAVVQRALQKPGIKHIASFADGDSGKVVGEVVYAGKTIRAPLSKRKCSYYHVLVEEYRRSKSGGFWYTLVEEEDMGDVVIDDGTGYAIIDTGKTMCYLIPDANYTSETFEDATPVLEKFLERHKTKSTALFGFNRTLRYKEGILEEGEMFAVAGEGQWNETQDHKLNLPTKKVLVITAQDEEKVYLSDDPVTFREGG